MLMQIKEIKISVIEIKYSEFIKMLWLLYYTCMCFYMKKI